VQASVNPSVAKEVVGKKEEEEDEEEEKKRRRGGKVPCNKGSIKRMTGRAFQVHNSLNTMRKFQRIQTMGGANTKYYQKESQSQSQMNDREWAG
jgi:hypothetical protein